MVSELCPYESNALVRTLVRGRSGRCVEAWDAILHSLSLCFLFLSVAFSSAHAVQRNNPASVPQAHMDPRPIHVSLIEGKDIRFTHLSGTQGLSQTRVDEIIQDDQGFIWFGTQVGVNRYDGYKFKVFSHDPVRPSSLSGTFVYSLFKDRSGVIWVGSDQSFDRFERATETFTHFHIDTPDPIVIHISQDSAGMLWLATEKGLYRFDPASGYVVRFHHDPKDAFSLSGDNIQSTGEDRERQFWVVTGAGLDGFDRATGKVTLHVPLPELVHGSLCAVACRSFHEDRFGIFWIIYGSGSGLAVFDRKTNRVIRYSFHDRESSSNALTGVNAILEDHNGTMWFATMGDGLLKFDRNHQRFVRYRRHPDDPESLAENRVIALFEDQEGNIWAGLHAVAPDRFANTQPPFEQFRPGSADLHAPGENLVNAIYEDRRGTLWMGAGEALIGIDRKTGQYTRYHPEGPRVNTEVLAIQEDRAGIMWVGMLGHGLSRFDPSTGQFKTYRRRQGDSSSLSNDTVTRILINRAGVMWVSTWDGLNRFDPATGRFTLFKQDPAKIEPYYSIVEGKDGFLWLGSKSGLVRFRPSTGQFTVFQHKPEDSTSLSDNTVDSIYEDHSGNLWLGTQGGLNRMEPKKGTFTAFYRKDGLPGNAVSCILADGRDNLWMSTNNGLSRFDPLTRTFKNYSVADGLPGNDLTGWDACFKSHTGEMFFGGFAGAVAFRPDQVLDSTYTPPVVFTDFQLAGRPVDIGPASLLTRSITYADDLKLSHKQGFFSVEFSALSFRSPTTNRYRYKLEGLDSGWHEGGSEQRVVSYTSLPAGTYKFRVQGATSRGPWTEPGPVLQIKILPPWWASWWFRTSCAAGLLLIGCAAYSYRMRQIARLFEVRLLSEQRLRRSEAFLSEGQRLSLTGTFCWKVATDEIMWSEQLYHIFEFESGTPVTIERINSRVHPEDAPMMKETIERARAGGAHFEYRHRLLMPDGSVKYVNAIAHGSRDATGRVEYIGAVQDVTQRHRSEEALSKARSEERREGKECRSRWSP